MEFDALTEYQIWAGYALESAAACDDHERSDFYYHRKDSLMTDLTNIRRQKEK